MHEDVDRLMPDPDRRDDALERIQATIDLADRIWPTHVLPHLTPGQTRVVEALSHGLGYSGAAEVLGMSEHTVQTHVKRAMRSMRAKNQAHLVAEALRHGMIR